MKWIKDSLLLNLFFLIIAIAVGYGAYRLTGQAVAVYRESMQNRKKIEELTQKKQELQAYLDRLQTPGEIERQAKERLNLKLSGEQVVVVVAPQASSTQEHTEQEVPKGWRRWLMELWDRL